MTNLEWVLLYLAILIGLALLSDAYGRRRRRREYDAERRGRRQALRWSER